MLSVDISPGHPDCSLDTIRIIGYPVFFLFRTDYGMFDFRQNGPVQWQPAEIFIQLLLQVFG
jgi:hypothetical protein